VERSGIFMDDIDRSLLEILQQNTTLSIAQMAERVGLSPTPCWKRIQKLEATGVITRRVAVVDPDRVGVGLSVLVSIEAGEHTPERLERFGLGVGAMPEVMEAYRMAGDVDYVLRMAVADMAEYDAFYKHRDRADEERHLALRDGVPQAYHCLPAPSARLPRPPRRQSRRRRIGVSRPCQLLRKSSIFGPTN
jgi:Lrp/AsnC family transcriptional regulator